MAYEGDSIFWVEVEKVVPNPFQPRREFSEEKLSELAESIRMYGVLQPLVVTRKEIIGEEGAFTTQYELIAGERRLRASKLAGLQQVPVIIRSEEESEQMKFELAIIENLQREDLNAVDRAMAFKQLAEQFKLSHAQVAKKMGRSREYVSNSIRLLQLPSSILNALKVGDISDGHARTLLMLNDRPEEQDTLFREILLKKLSVREVERIARKIATDKVRKKDWGVDPEIIEIEKQFTETLGTRVQITKTDYGGKVTIDYFSQDDLEKLYQLVNHDDANIVMHNEQEGGTTIAKIAAATPLAAAENNIAAAPTPVESQFEVYRNGDDDPVEVEDLHTQASVAVHEQPVDAEPETAAPIYMAPEFAAYRNATEATPAPAADAATEAEHTATPESGVSEPQQATESVADAFPLTRVEDLRTEHHAGHTTEAHVQTQPTPPTAEPVAAKQGIHAAPAHPPVHDDVETVASPEHAPEKSVAPSESSETKKEDDTDLYSLKHFSL
ncbi:MAG: ParB/RepB/Spo0J family partition protein [Candidatus Pacebacteria bacterium]|nr:ParB/RepB/Spo0J family partition protein [Candidatus Paceibacterota bacterium]